MPRHWQVLILAALGIGATLLAVPRALGGLVAVPQGGSSPAISRAGIVTQSAKSNTATMPGWSPSPTTSSAAPDTRPPTAVVNLRIASNSDSAAQIGWDPSSDNVAVRGYIVKIDGYSSEQITLQASVSWARRTGPVLVLVAAVDTSGNVGDWRSITVSPPKTAMTSATTVPTTTSPTTAAPAPVVASSTPPPTSTPTATTSQTPTASTTTPTTSPLSSTVPVVSSAPHPATASASVR